MSARVGDVLSRGHGPEARLVMLALGVAGSFQCGMPAHRTLGTQLGEGHIAKLKRLTPKRDTRNIYPGVNPVFRSVKTSHYTSAFARLASGSGPEHRVQ